MKRIIVSFLCLVLLAELAGCEFRSTKRDYEEAPHVMTIVDKTAGYTIYRHDDTGVWYFCRDAGQGKSVCPMLNNDGTPYTR